MWEHKHLGLLRCNGKTNGTAIAKQLRTTLEKFGLLGKLFSSTFDGGSNFRTAHQQLLAMQEGNYACVVVKLRMMYVTRCLAHIINGAIATELSSR